MIAVLKPNDLVAGRYSVVRLLASGGMGAVYLVDDTRLIGKQWALKVLNFAHLPPGEQTEVKRLFESEARVLSRLRHPGIPVVIDYLAHGSEFILVMDFVPGKTLKALLEERLANGRPFSSDEVATIGRQLGTILSYLHGQTPPVLYRDMKPENVIVCDDGALVLIDFGLAGLMRQAQPGPQTQGVTICMGTPGYAAPEQYTLNRPTDVRTDVYGLGATLHHLLTGRDSSPFMHTDVRKVRLDVPNWLAAVIGKALAGDPDDRFQTVQELSRALSGDTTITHRLSQDPELRQLLQQALGDAQFYSQNSSVGKRPDVMRKLGLVEGYLNRDLTADVAGLLREIVDEVADMTASSLFMTVKLLVARFQELEGRLDLALVNYQVALSSDPSQTALYQAVARVKQKLALRVPRWRRILRWPLPILTAVGGWVGRHWGGWSAVHAILLGNHWLLFDFAILLGFAVGFWPFRGVSSVWQDPGVVQTGAVIWLGPLVLRALIATLVSVPGRFPSYLCLPSAYFMIVVLFQFCHPFAPPSSTVVWGDRSTAVARWAGLDLLDNSEPVLSLAERRRLIQRAVNRFTGAIKTDAAHKGMVEGLSTTPAASP